MEEAIAMTVASLDDSSLASLTISENQVATMEKKFSILVAMKQGWI